jgi:phosphate transport system protein
MTAEVRSDYHRHLEEIDRNLARMIALVEESIAAASTALLSPDEATAIDTVAANVSAIADLHRSVESLVFTQMVRQQPVAGELRFLVAALRIVPELELTAALAANLARRRAMHIASELSPRMRGLVSQLFQRAIDMWRRVGDAYADRSAVVAVDLEEDDEEIDELYVSLTAELASGALRPPVLVEMALVARFLERLGDHAVEVGRWIESYSPAPPALVKTDSIKLA